MFQLYGEPELAIPKERCAFHVLLKYTGVPTCWLEARFIFGTLVAKLCANQPLKKTRTCQTGPVRSAPPLYLSHCCVTKIINQLFYVANAGMSLFGSCYLHKCLYWFWRMSSKVVIIIIWTLQVTVHQPWSKSLRVLAVSPEGAERMEPLGRSLQ